MKDLTRGTAGSSAGDRASLRASSPFPHSGMGSNGTSSNSPSTSKTAVPETSLQRICRHLPGAIYQFSWRTDGSITCSFISPGCRTLFDLDPIDVIRDASIVTSLIHPEDLPSFNRSVALSVKTLQVWNWEGRIVTPAGATKWIQAAAHLERGASGEVIWEGMAMEISPGRGIQPPTPTFPAELTLQQMPDPVFVRDTHQRWLFANQAFCDLFNCTQEDLLSGGWDGTFPTPIATGITEGEQCLNAETDTPRQVRVRQHMVASEAGDRFWVGSVQDITANKQEVAQWRSAWEALQRVVDSIPAALFWKDRDSTYQGCNRSYAKVIGIKHPDDLRGSSDYDLPWRREEADWLREQDKTVMQDNAAASDIVELPNPGKPTTSWFHNRRLPLQDAQGDVGGVRGHVGGHHPIASIPAKPLATKAWHDSPSLAATANPGGTAPRANPT
ncbi:MAG: PAS domain-containing protein [Coleofasciculaceae cyanobacterium SM2_3_26]|nr:PAS domain-containing protein [Coleofasciculaceae cyanobacterium SM2_3_26]